MVNLENSIEIIVLLYCDVHMKPYCFNLLVTPRFYKI